jgi:thioredoxin 1
VSVSRTRNRVAMATTIETDAELRALLRSETSVLVDFFAPWCGPCKKIAPLFSELAEQHPELKFCKVDVDECEAVCEELGVESLPTIQWWRGGSKIQELCGADETKLISLVNAAAASKPSSVAARGTTADAAAASDASTGIVPRGVVIDIWGRTKGQSGLANFTRQPRRGTQEVDITGLVDSANFHDTPSIVEDFEKIGIADLSCRNDRALCCTSPQNLKQLSRDFPALANGDFHQPCAFGQNLTIDGLCTKTLCVGDVFLVLPAAGEGSARTTLLEVSSPRRPCSEVDQNFGAFDIFRCCILRGIAWRVFLDFCWCAAHAYR